MRDNNKKEMGFRREFLNNPNMVSTSSNISYYINLETWQEELQKVNLFTSADVRFSISDCYKSITLDFEINTKEDMRNSLYKLDTIIDVCTSMKEDLKKARLEILKGQKFLKELEENKEKK